MGNWSEFADWMMKGMLGGVIGYGVHILAGMKNSIDHLNVQVGKIIERTDWHSKEIERLDQRIDRFEERECDKPS